MISACLPTYRPLWNRYGGGRPNGKITRATSKAYGSKTTELKHLKSTENKTWSLPGDDQESVTYDGPYTRLGTVTDVESQWEGGPIATNNDIVVTRGFASSKTGI